MREAGELKRALDAAKGSTVQTCCEKKKKSLQLSDFHFVFTREHGLLVFRKMLTSFLLRFISFLFLDLNSPAKIYFFLYGP